MPQVTRLSDKTKEGFLFAWGRWEGEEYELNALAAAAFLRGQFKKTGVHTGEEKVWVGGKQTTRPYYKVWVGHPSDADLYAWWVPSTDTWNDRVKPDRLTWFEFQSSK